MPIPLEEPRQYPQITHGSARHAAARGVARVAAVVLAATSAWASPALARGHDVAGLPEAGVAVAAVPAALPASIPATETVKGLYVGAATAYGRHDMYEMQLFTSEEDARNGHVGAPGVEKQEPACIFRDDGGGRGESFGHGFGARVTYLQVPKASNSQRSMFVGSSYARVQRIRLDRIERTGGDAATLVMTDVFVDVEQRGLRAHREARMPLTRVATGPGGVQLFAAKDTASHGVHVVLVTEPQDRRLPLSSHASLTLDSRSSSKDCGLSHALLRSSPGVGDVASIELDVLLATTEIAAREPEPPKRIVPLLLPSVAAPATPQRELRIRKLRVHLSLTQTSSDPGPVLATSVGWAGREQRATVFF